MAEEIASELNATLDATERLSVGPFRVQLLLEYVHREMNLLGFLPAEERILGMMAADL
ncbi:hypothetical protein AB4Y87_02840 [Paenarthrobacter sp. RAF54_2]|uniref:hypothetical protein n=1 Tax=Paenarthrobacter sp. RAF54_2 TaxID=3233061 RepID=UPI003F9ABB4F